MNIEDNMLPRSTRRQFLGAGSSSLGALALLRCWTQRFAKAAPILPELNVSGRAKKVIYLFQSGGPPQQDLFDYKPQLEASTARKRPPPSSMASV